MEFLQRTHFPGNHAIIYFVDSNDKDRIDEAADDLENIVRSPYLKYVRKKAILSYC